jgi:hypothetical protein
VLANYYRQNFDISTAKKFCETSISLALVTGNTKVQSQALTNFAWINRNNGDYFTAQVHGKEAQRLARISADLYREAQALLRIPRGRGIPLKVTGKVQGGRGRGWALLKPPIPLGYLGRFRGLQRYSTILL